MNLTYLRLEILRLIRNRRILVISMVIPIVLLLVIGNTVGKENDAHAYIMTSMALLGAISAALGSGGQIAVERGLGWNRSLRLTPLKPAWYVISKVLLALLMAVPPILSTFAVAALALHVRLDAGTWFAVFGAAWLSALPFAALGVVVGYLAKADSVQQVISLLYLGLAALGGLWVPIENMPKLMRDIAQWTPSYWAGKVTRSPFLDGHLSLRAVEILLGWAVVLGFVALRRFRADTARG